MINYNTIKVHTNSSGIQEKKYIIDVMLKDFLGFAVEVIEDDLLLEHYIVEFNAKKIYLTDFFIHKANSNWLGKSTLPTLPLEQLNIKDCKIDINTDQNFLPIIYGNKNVEIEENISKIGADIFGSSFFMLSRYEEIVLDDKDKRLRFETEKSVSYLSHFMERPIVNEYLELLWGVMKFMDRGLIRKERKFKINASCDVDNIRDKASVEFKPLVKRLGSSLLKNRSIESFLNALNSYYSVRFKKDIQKDSYNTFDFLMDVSESNGIKHSFYFISKNKPGGLDADYGIFDEDIAQLLNNIDRRGHEIGIHYSYDTLNNIEMASNELANINNALHKLNIKQRVVGGRQHYLRMDISTSPRIWNDIGVEYDSTIGFANHIGFRSGTCYEYNLYDLNKREVLSVKEKPLMVMDGAAFLDVSMGLSKSEGYNRIMKVKNIVKMYKGDFNILWHNSFFTDVRYFDIYKRIIEL